MTVRSTASERAHRTRFAGRRALLAVAALAAAGTVGAAGVVTAAPAGARAKPITVIAIETEFHIALSKKTFTPGRYTFVAKDKGQLTHALTITGPGLRNATTKNIGPGQSTTLTVTLRKGTYDVYCPVPGHRMLGMNLNLVVRAPALTVTTATTATTSPGTGSSSG